MNRDDIIRMAREAGFLHSSRGRFAEPKAIERFAALVAAHEREECAKVCDGEYQSWIDKFSDGAVSVKTCAAAIRARGNT